MPDTGPTVQVVDDVVLYDCVFLQRIMAHIDDAAVGIVIRRITVGTTVVHRVVIEKCVARSVCASRCPSIPTLEINAPPRARTFRRVSQTSVIDYVVIDDDGSLRRVDLAEYNAITLGVMNHVVMNRKVKLIVTTAILGSGIQLDSTAPLDILYCVAANFLMVAVSRKIQALIVRRSS